MFYERTVSAAMNLHCLGATVLVSDRNGQITGYCRVKRKCEVERLGTLFCWLGKAEARTTGDSF